jgi:hypothetical protein
MPSKKVVVSCVCQTPGIAESIGSAGIFEVAAFPVFDYSNTEATSKLLALLNVSDVWVTTPDAPPLEQQFARLQRVSVPVATYGAFHPDFAALTPREKAGQPLRVKYHSGIVATCFKHRIPVEQVAGFFNRDTYAKLGFFNAHETAGRRFQEDFQSSSLGARWREIFREMKRGGPFMHTPSHPNAHAHRVMAEAVLHVLGVSTPQRLALPADYLAYLRWPLYPQLEALTGLEGSYYWVLKDQYNPKELRLATLESFVRYYYSRYEAEPLLASRDYAITNTLNVDFEALLR